MVVSEAPVLVAFFVVGSAVGFVAVCGVALVYFGVFEAPCKLLLDGEGEEGFCLVSVNSWLRCDNLMGVEAY